MEQYIEPSYQQIHALLKTKFEGPVLMFSLVKFRGKALFQKHEKSKMAKNLTGEEAFDIYLDKVVEVYKKLGIELLHNAKTHIPLIGPMDETWDRAVLVRFKRAGDLVRLSATPSFHKADRYRLAGVSDNRIWPMTDIPRGLF